jgi:hypothetical protein
MAMTGLCLETQLLTPFERSRRVPMTPLTDFGKFPVSVHAADFVLSSHDNSPPFVRGKDKQNRPWEVRLRYALHGVWQSGEGESRVYYFAGYTGAAGLAPMVWIVALTFDSDRRPVPFYIITHGTYNRKGIDDVVDLDGDGPQILEQSYTGSRMSDPGYYITVLYQKRGPYWYRSDGKHGAHIFPTFEKWSLLWRQDRPAQLAPTQAGLSVRDSGNDPANGVKTQLITRKDNTIRLQADVGCNDIDIDTVVTDTPAKRRIIFLEPTESLPALDKKPVILTGLYHWPKSDSCKASILWATTDR